MMKQKNEDNPKIDSYAIILTQWNIQTTAIILEYLLWQPRIA